MPTHALRDEASLARVLRALLARHNFRVALLSVLTLVAAIALWAILRAAVGWLALLFVSAIKGVDAQPPAWIDGTFWTVAFALIALAWLDRRLHPDERPKDYKSPGDIAWEFILAVPRLTLAVWGTLSAWQRLDDREIADAVALIERLEHEPRLRLSSIPLEIPAAGPRFKILFALQLLQVLEIRREDNDLWVRLSPLRPGALVGGRSARDAGLQPQAPPKGVAGVPLSIAER